MQRNIFLSLGSNLGHRSMHLHRALCYLDAELSIEKVSKAYRTNPWGNTDQPRFINLALQCSTGFSPIQLLDFVQDIENQMGRTRERHWGPRNIDIDILFFDRIIMDTRRLTLPHPYLSERRFVLEPLCEIAPEWIHPSGGKSMRELLNHLDR